MKLALPVVQTTGTSTEWDDGRERGTVLDNLEEKDFIDFGKRNLAGDNAVNLFVYDDAKKTNAPGTLVCSTGLSKQVRAALKAGVDRTELMSSLLELRVIEVEDEDTGQPLFIIVRNAGERTVATSVKSVKRANTINFEDFAVV